MVSLPFVSRLNDVDGFGNRPCRHQHGGVARFCGDPKRRPTHPGAILREDVLPALGMTQKEFAGRLGVSRLTVSELLHEKRAVTADMAMRLGRLLGNGPEIGLRMQQTLDLWTLAQRGGYEGIQTLKAA